MLNPFTKPNIYIVQQFLKYTNSYINLFILWSLGPDSLGYVGPLVAN